MVNKAVKEPGGQLTRRFPSAGWADEEDLEGRQGVVGSHGYDAGNTKYQSKFRRGACRWRQKT